MNVIQQGLQKFQNVKAVQKAKATKQNFDFMTAFFSLCQDPNDTARVFVMEKRLNARATPEALRRLVNFLKQRPEIAAMMQERYAPPAYRIADLAACAPGTLGYAYYRHMSDNGFSPDFYPAMQADSDLNYYKLRTRQTHDIWHVVAGYSPSLDDEIGLQAFYTGQVPMPFTTLLVATGLVHSAIYNQKLIPSMYEAIKQGWDAGRAAKCIHGVKWEEMWDRPLADIRREHNIKPAKTLYDFAPAPEPALA